MKKRLFLAVFALGVFATYAQTIPEPEFIGEAYLVNLDNPMYRKLPKERGIVRATNFMGNFTKRIILSEGSPLQISDRINIGVIIKMDNNSYDPVSVFQVFKLPINGYRQRVIELSRISTGSYLAVGEGNVKSYVDFTAEKYGESSYLLRFPISEGHYGIITGDIDEEKLLITTFDVYDAAKKEREERARMLEQAEWERREQERLAKKQARLAKKQARATIRTKK